MLNIRINLTINLKKVSAGLLAGMIFMSHLVTPAYAITAAIDAEKPTTVSLQFLTVTTTKAQAALDLASPTVKYFDPQAIAFLTTFSQGWSRAEWVCLNNLWNSESHFNPKALNMSSHAFGIAQFLPTTWGNYKVAKTTSAALQIQYGLRYVQKRYGSINDPAGACNAWRFHQKTGWY